MLSIGLTGGIASGKSTAVRLMAECGAVVIEADKVAREVMAPGGAVFKEIIDHFGERIIDGSGGIDRAGLAALIFADENERRFLNSRTHPLIVGAIKKKLSTFYSGKHLIVVEAPLLIEAEMMDLFDKIVVVASTPELQVVRLEAKGFTEAEALLRLRAQISDAERYKYADFIILNKGSLINLEEQVDNLMEKLLNEGQ